MLDSDKKLSPKKQRCITALLSEPSIRDAARVVGITEQTVHRWLKSDDFQREYQAARSDLYQFGITRLQAMMSQAIDRIEGLLDAKDTPPTVLLGTCKLVIESAQASYREEEFIERLKRLEKELL